MIKSNYFSSNSDIQNHFTKFIDWTEIIDEYENDFQDSKEYSKTKDEFLASAPNNYSEAIEYYRYILDALGDVTGNIVSEHVKVMDSKGVIFRDGKVQLPEELIACIEKAREAGIQPYGFMRKYGGLGIPFTVRALFGEILYRVDTSFAIALGCVNLGEILERIASEEMKNFWIPKMAAGKFSVSMGLTEPNFGSDLPNITTNATKSDNGKWLLNGTKRFITQASGIGDIPGLILTLARSGGNGARGLSFFLVQSKDVQIAGVEKKLGLHASPTCEVVFENSEGLLIGEEGLGLVRYTMGMLNGARMGIAAQGVGMATAAYEEAKIFAITRIQFGKAIGEIPVIQKLLRKMEREILAMRCLMVESGRSVDMYYWRQDHLKKEGLTSSEISKDEKVRQYLKLADFLTPTSKFYCTEYCNKIAYDALQIHGGSGFTEDYDIARIYRDARITTIYDGTSQIQVMAAIGGIISGMTEKGQLRKYLEGKIASFDASIKTQSLFSEFSSLVFLFKSIASSDSREGFASDLVEIAARVIAAVNLEKTSHKLDGQEKAERLSHTNEYSLDTMSMIQANLYKWKNLE